MIYINQIAYSIEDLKAQSQFILANEKLEDWEVHFWSFVKDWFSKNVEFISVKTSGSTGLPKTIMHKKEFMRASARMTCQFFELNENKTALLCLSANTIGGMMMITRALVSGMSLIVQKPDSNPLQHVDRNIDFVAMVPFQVQQTFEQCQHQFEKVNTIIIGGGAVSESLQTKLKHLKTKAYSTFGMTETISHIALLKIGENKVFKALKNVKFSLSKENTLVINAIDLGVQGLETNDLVNLIDNTSFEWLGRKDNAIESGGFKFLPEVLEEKLLPFISKPFIVSALPDVQLNNKLVLIIESDAFDLNAERFESVLSKYETPKQIFFVKKMVYTVNGKINRLNTQKLILGK